MSVFVANHPIIAMGLYVLFCIFVGIGIYIAWANIRKRIEIKRNMKGRAKNDQSR